MIIMAVAFIGLLIFYCTSLRKIQDNDDDNDGEGGDDDYNAEYEVAVECKNEAEQREVFRLMTEKGFPCRILTI